MRTLVLRVGLVALAGATMVTGVPAAAGTCAASAACTTTVTFDVTAGALESLSDVAGTITHTVA